MVINWQGVVWRWQSVAIAAPTALAIVLGLSSSGLLARPEAAALDLMLNGATPNSHSLWLRPKSSPEPLAQHQLGHRPSPRPVPPVGQTLWLGMWTLCGAGLLAWRRNQVQRNQVESRASWNQQVMRSGLAEVAIAALTLGSCSYSLIYAGWWLPPVAPLLGLGSGATLVVGHSLYRTRQFRKNLGRQDFPQQWVTNLLETPMELELAGETRQVTTLVVGIRGFASLTDYLSAQRVVTLLNLYFEALHPVIQRYGGSINQILGDQVIVVFGAPITADDDPHRAVACAVAMQAAMGQVNRQNVDLLLPEVEIGIGINTGEVFMGNLGFPQQMKYSAVGRQLNLAARVESFTVGGQILIAESTFDEVKEVARIEGQTQAYIKDLDTPLAIYEVTGIGGAYNLMLPEDLDAFVDLKEPIQLQYTLRGSGDPGWRQDSVQESLHETLSHPSSAQREESPLFHGQILRISARGAEIQTLNPPRPLSPIQMTLCPQLVPRLSWDREEFGDEESGLIDLGLITAQVMHRPGADEFSFFVRFTQIPPKASEYLQKLRSDRRARR
jgi:adenylate cyclase